jgi:hypothetical protein
MLRPTRRERSSQRREGRRRYCTAIALLQRENGQATLEYLLILALVVIPLYPVVQMLFRILLRYYEVISFFLSMPFP